MDVSEITQGEETLWVDGREWRHLISMEILMRKIWEKIMTIIDDVIGETYINSTKEEIEDKVYAP
ncbi:hypothetical protein [Bacillus subtilis]|uniref:hypothetical protein n=1 Tax=Bacillus subtilis TaxID=1423 RepID=UPI003D7F759D